MRQRAAILLIQNKQILLIHRFRQGEEYYVIPGGGIEEGETPEQAALREFKEETNLETTIDSLFLQFENTHFHQNPGELEYFFLAHISHGELTFTNSPEATRKDSTNTYALEWIPLDQVATLNLLPPALKEKLIKELAS